MNMSATAIADEIGVAERTVRRWVTQGRLTATRSGRELAIDLDEARAVKLRSRQGRVSLREQQHAELRGRYLELKEQIQRLEEELTWERAKRLEAELRLRSTA